MKNFVILLLLIQLTSCQETKEETFYLPKLGNVDIEYKTVHGKEIADTVYPKIPYFEFLNQDSSIFKSSSIQGKIWVSEFFFTTCSTICPKMTKQMVRLQKNLKDLQSQIEFLSFTINPDYDQPSVLKNYAQHFNIDEKNWNLLTGDEEFTHLLGVEHFFVHADQSDEAVDGYAHSDAFTLVDRQGYVRGVYKGTVPEEVDRLEKDLRNLLKFEYGIK